MSVAEHLVETFQANRKRVAIVEPGGATTTYATLLDETARMQTHLRQVGLAPASRVILATPRGLPFTVAAIALLLEGHVAVGIELAQGDHVYRDRADAMDAAAVMTSPVVHRLQALDPVRRGIARFGLAVPPRLTLPSIECPAPASVPQPSHPIQTTGPADEEDIALIVFTGGTTSAPKGVQLSHRAIRAYLDGLNQLPEWAELDSIVADHPQQVLYGLAHAKTVYLSKARPSARAAHIAQLVFRDGVHGYFGAPTTWASILDHGAHREPAASRPKAILLGGAPVTQPLLERLDRELPAETAVRCLYGMTEIGLVAHCSGKEKLTQLETSQGDPVGTILPTVTARLGPDGELLVSGPSRFSGYVDEQAVTADVPFATGDFASISNDKLSLLGRKKDMILHDGVNLYPAQFEGRLLALQDNGTTAFRELALIGVPTGVIGNEEIVICYTCDGDLPPARAVALANTVLPLAHPAVRSLRLDFMPTSGRQNKLDRQKLRTMAMGTCGTNNLHEQQRDMLARLGAAAPRSPKRIALAGLTRANFALCRRSNVPPAAIDNPVVILGHQRSGTTTVHRALAGADGATAMPLVDMVAPHVLGWRIASIADRVGRIVGRRHPGRRLNEIDSMHPLSLFEAEEQEFLFAAWGLSGYLPSIFEATLGDASFDRFRDRARWPVGDIDALFDLHDSTLERWLRHRRIDPETRVIVKNPALGPLADHLAVRWSQATFIVMLRDPTDAIESRLRLVATVNGRTLDQSEIDVVVRDSQRQMQGLAHALPAIPAERVRTVWFDDLVADPDGTVQELAAHCGLGPAAAVTTCTSTTSGPLPSMVARDSIEAAVPDFRALCGRPA